MISIEASRNGLPVITKDGKFLDSSVDPLKSAETWAKAAMLSIGNATGVVVLGLGSGYHVLALNALAPNLKLVVVESDPLLAKEVLRIQPKLKNMKIVAEEDWSRLLEHDSVREVTHEIFRVLKYAPSVQAADLFYQRAESMILARDRIGFFLQLRDRPELLRISSMDKLEALPSGPISIKTVAECQRQGPHGAYEREALLWKILGELVK